jgi:hypothetical protein
MQYEVDLCCHSPHRYPNPDPRLVLGSSTAATLAIDHHGLRLEFVEVKVLILFLSLVSLSQQR